MKVDILGTVGYHPTEQRHTTCVLLPELGIAFDAGSSFFRVPHLLTGNTLDIFLSHTHLDHVLGLTYFFSLIAKHPLERISVHGQAQKLQSLREHLFSADLFPVQPPYDWCPLENSELQIGPARIRWFPLLHPGESVGYRVDCAGKSLAFITDTNAAESAGYLEHIRQVDLLIHECNFPDGQEELAARTGHSCLSAVVNLAAQAQVKRLVLLHVDPILEITPQDIEAARSIFPQVELAHDLYSTQV